MKKEKIIKLCHFKKNGPIIEGIYKYYEPNTWKPIIYFRKPKGVLQEEYDEVVNIFRYE